MSRKTIVYLVCDGCGKQEEISPIWKPTNHEWLKVGAGDYCPDCRGRLGLDLRYLKNALKEPIID